MSKQNSADDLGLVLSHQMFRALGDPTRIHLVGLLAERCHACSVSELADCLDVDLSVVSRHLALLRAAGVLRANKVGRAVLYQIQYDVVAEALRGIADALERARDDFSPTTPCNATGHEEEQTPTSPPESSNVAAARRE